eukprot:2929637-Pyramimonas_sp.AAC.1
MIGTCRIWDVLRYYWNQTKPISKQLRDHLNMRSSPLLLKCYEHSTPIKWESSGPHVRSVPIEISS